MKSQEPLRRLHLKLTEIQVCANVDPGVLNGHALHIVLYSKNL